MPYKDISTPIFSEKLFMSYQDLVLDRVFKGLHVSIVSYRGAGKPTELRFMLDKLSNTRFALEDKHRIFIWMDASMLLTDESSAYKNALVHSNFSKIILSDELKTILSHLNSEDTISYGEFSAFLEALCSKGLNISLVIKNFGSLFGFSNNHRVREIGLIRSFLAINSMQISYIFLCDREFSDTDGNFIGDLTPYYMSNIVWGNELFFEKEDVAVSLSTYEKVHDISFPDELRRFLAKYMIGEPTVLKYFIYSYISDDAKYEHLWKNTSDDAVYTVLNSSWLDNRYAHIVSNVTPQSLEALREGNKNNYSKFLIETGLAREDMRLFSYYVKERNLENNQNSMELTLTEPSKIKKHLSGQELIAFQFLLTNRGEIVTRDDISRAIWQDAWEEKYTDWALDKIISRLRKKIGDTPEYTLKTIRGRGLTLL